MASSRERVLGLLAVFVGLVVDVGSTRLLGPYLPDFVNWLFSAAGAAPEEARSRTAAFFARYGAYAGVGFGWLCTFVGGFVTGALAGRARVEHALAMGVLSALQGLPVVAGLFLTQGASPGFWLVAQAVVRTVPFAVLGGGLSALLFRRRGARSAEAARRRPEGVPEDPPGAGRDADVVRVDAPAPSVAAAAPSAGRASFRGTGGDLFGTHVVNIFLTLVTFGLYRFWAKVRVRRFLYGHTEFEGDRFAYHGTGRELFRGWSKAMAYIGLPLFGLRMLESVVDSVPALLVLKLVGAAVAVVVVPVAIAGAWRYRLSRTEWRGIRFSFRGRAKEAVKVFALGSLLTFLSLGLYLPALQVNIHRFLVKDSYFGTRRFAFDGEGAALMRRYARFLLLAGPTGVAAFLLAPFTYGLSVAAGAVTIVYAWHHYAAAKQRYLMGHTTFGGARFRSTVTGRGLFGLNLGNLLLRVFTVGLGAPWAYVRSMRYALDHLALEGTLDFASIEQEAQAASPIGEGIADVADADGFELGLGV